ncbi:MAG: hypothetical protein A2142_08700 [candidate division Zixibacteria bacterium RBG_16_48_11]|nr:MAG: hypothetical protein A2142_08700 [candidate division Zixibacteria bacterium RBG_16_48_11]
MSAQIIEGKRIAAKVKRRVMSYHIKAGILVGVAGFLAEMFLTFVFMGIPIGSILLAVPVGIVTGRKVAQGRNLKQPVSDKLSLQAGLISGVLSSLGIVGPLLLFALTAPQGATLGAELQKWVDPDKIPGFLNSLPTALILGAMMSALVATGLAVCSCLLTTRNFNKRIIFNLNSLGNQPRNARPNHRR